MAESQRLIWTSAGPHLLSPLEYLWLSFTCVADPVDDPPRHAIECAIEANLEDPRVDQFIALLDTLDGDIDLEPSMGLLPRGVGDETEDCGDDEYALGSLEAVIDQSEWAIDRSGRLQFDIDCEFDATE